MPQVATGAGDLHQLTVFCTTNVLSAHVTNYKISCSKLDITDGKIAQGNVFEQSQDEYSTLDGNPVQDNTTTSSLAASQKVK